MNWSVGEEAVFVRGGQQRGQKCRVVEAYPQMNALKVKIGKSKVICRASELETVASYEARKKLGVQCG